MGWGRSMGAVSLLTSTECDIMVADSATPISAIYARSLHRSLYLARVAASSTCVSLAFSAASSAK